MPRDSSSNKRTDPLLRRADQGCAGVLLAISLLAMLSFWIQQNSDRGGIIEIGDPELQPPLQFQVDINKASWPELILLPNIGEQRAKDIVASREQDGSFLDINDLQRIRGIGPKTVEGLRLYLLPIPTTETTAGP